jgi:hypothetical protein
MDTSQEVCIGSKGECTVNRSEPSASQRCERKGRRMMGLFRTSCLGMLLLSCSVTIASGEAVGGSLMGAADDMQMGQGQLQLVEQLLSAGMPKQEAVATIVLLEQDDVDRLTGELSGVRGESAAGMALVIVAVVVLVYVASELGVVDALPPSTD